MNTPVHHSPRSSLRRASWLLLALGGGCTVEQDAFRSEGGTSPDPSAILRGSVLYRGPLPSCDYDGEEPVRVRGRVVLTLFAYDDPPPPQGRAELADNVLFIDGDALFSLDDCAPEDLPSAQRSVVTRSAAFDWPELGLAAAPRDLQLRGFFDADEDMNPFFDVTRMPSAGDVIGAALADDGSSVRRITLPARTEAPDGLRTARVLVTLASLVRSERPRFRLGKHRALSAEAVIPFTVDAGEFSADPRACLDAPSACVDRSALLRATRALTCPEPGDDCGFTIDALREDEAQASYRAAGLTADFSPEATAFFSAPIDLLSVREGELDIARPDGAADPHPIFGALAEVSWHAPVLVLRRRALDAQEAARERSAGIPEVTLIGSPLLDATGALPERSVYLGSVPMVVPPIALVDLDPARDDCRVPYVPAGNFKDVYEARVVHCGELPTGLFAASVIGGVAGGERSDDPRSDLGYSYAGAVLSGQAWRVPNELGDPAQVGRAHALAQQGPDEVFVVHDPRPARAGDCGSALDAASAFVDEASALLPVSLRGVCDDRPAVRELALGVDVPSCLPAPCCDAVRHLCDLPLCPVCDADRCPDLSAAGFNVRRGPSALNNDGARPVPDCVPFALPSQCCE